MSEQEAGAEGFFSVIGHVSSHFLSAEAYEVKQPWCLLGPALPSLASWRSAI